jgi:hypothetical protein
LVAEVGVRTRQLKQTIPVLLAELRAMIYLVRLMVRVEEVSTVVAMEL